ncbi:MAG: hypothetical protein QOJ91_2167 [Sphingomonadales bacterium]|nr:hypothetical protein [Sphingomonadales bacterium]
MALAASLVLASATMFATIASARVGPPRDPACDARVVAECSTSWQTLGYPNQSTCVGGQQCIECPPTYGYLCGGPSIYYGTEQKGVEPW